MNVSARSIVKPPFSDSSPNTTLFSPFKRHFQFRFGIEQDGRVYPSVLSGDSVNVCVRSVAKPQLSVSSHHNLIRFLKNAISSFFLALNKVVEYIRWFRVVIL